MCNRRLRARTCPVGSRYSYGGGTPWTWALSGDIGSSLEHMTESVEFSLNDWATRRPMRPVRVECFAITGVNVTATMFLTLRAGGGGRICRGSPTSPSAGGNHVLSPVLLVLSTLGPGETDQVLHHLAQALALS